MQDSGGHAYDYNPCYGFQGQYEECAQSGIAVSSHKKNYCTLLRSVKQLAMALLSCVEQLLLKRFMKKAITDSYSITMVKVEGKLITLRVL